MVLPAAQPRMANVVSLPNICTIQHILPKSHKDYNDNFTLWCYKCNEEDSIYKQKNKIYSREEFIYELICEQTKKYVPLDGYYVIDGMIYGYTNHKMVEYYSYFEFKLLMLKDYMGYFIDSFEKKDKRAAFDDVFKNCIKGAFEIEQYKIGNGWYQKPIL